MLHMFGGKPWAKIAEVALKAWGENTVDQKALLLDTAFHLQHNNGFVFDKDRKIHFSPETEQERRILDAKFKARDLGELINFIKTEITNEELLKEIDQLVSTINRVNELKPVKKGGGY